MQIIIIGNSAAGLNALETFRKYDNNSKVILISKELGPAYSKVLLPYYLREKISYDKLFLTDNNYYQELNAETYFGCEVTRIDDRNNYVVLDNGTILSYDKLLIATGADPVKPPIQGINGSGIYHMWTLSDAEVLDPYYHKGKRVLILGSGFVSLQAAWSALNRGMKVSIYELAPRIMPQVLDAKAAEVLEQKILEAGAELKVNITTEKIERNIDGTLTVFAKGLDPLTVDLVIVGTGVRPNLGFLEGSRIKTNKGILVNNRMETNLSGIYAAGDVAQGPTVFGDNHAICALWPTAVEEGKVAGANMAGVDTIYQGSLNMNVTEMFGITVASMGKFIEDESNRIEEYANCDNSRYIKIVYKGDIPLGSVVVGSSDDVELLGLLRPLIRNNKLPDQFIKMRINLCL